MFRLCTGRTVFSNELQQLCVRFKSSTRLARASPAKARTELLRPKIGAVKRASRSKFDSPKDNAVAREFEARIREKLEKDGTAVDDEFIKDIAQEWSENFPKGKILDKPQFENTATRESLLDFVDWVIRDAQKTLSEAREVPMDEHDMGEQSEDLEQVMGEIAELYRSNGLEMLVPTLRTLHEDPHSTIQAVPLQKLAELFNLATQLEDPEKKSEAIYLAGDVLYTTPRLRADPINESFYIDALITHKKYSKAEYLWRSRSDKPDVENLRFWLDLGIKININKLNLGEAERLASECLKKFNYIHPSISQLFIIVYLRLKQPEQAWSWWKLVKEQINQTGLSKHSGELNVGVTDPQQIYEYLESEDRPTYADVVMIIQSFIEAGEFERAIKIMNGLMFQNSGMAIDGIVRMIRTQLTYPSKELLLQHIRACPSRKLVPFAKQRLEKVIVESRASKDAVPENPELLYTVLEQLKRLKSEGAQKMATKLSEGNLVTSQDFTNLLKVLLKAKSRNTLSVANELVEQMNQSLELQREGKETGMIPPADAHMYTILVQHLARRKQNTVPQIEELMHIMNTKGVQPNAHFANQVVHAYWRRKMYAPLFEYAEKCLENESIELTEKFYVTMFRVHYKYLRSLQLKQAEITDEKTSIRNLFHQFVNESHLFPQVASFETAIPAFLVSGDFAGAAAVIEYMGTVLNMPPSQDMVAVVGHHVAASWKRTKRAYKREGIEIPLHIEEASAQYFSQLDRIMRDMTKNSKVQHQWSTPVGMILAYERISSALRPGSAEEFFEDYNKYRQKLLLNGKFEEQYNTMGSLEDIISQF